jgi:hypothetical protein
MDDHTTSVVRGLSLPAEEAAKLEAGLGASPDDFEARAQLVGFYFRNEVVGSRQRRNEHALWVIRNRPESEVAGTPFVSFDEILDGNAFHAAAELWRDYASRDDAPAAILRNAALFFFLDKELCERLLKGAVERQPDDRRTLRELALFYLRNTRKHDATDGGREASERAFATLERCRPADEGDREWASWAVLASKASFGATRVEEASRLCHRLLELHRDGEAVHHGNVILGRIAVRRGKIERARKHLIAAGKTPGSPQLNSFGPNMQLAQDLLEQGETSVVIDYLKLCKGFWPRSEVDRWSEDIMSGRAPNFGANLWY